MGWYDIFLIIMWITAVFVFAALFFETAGYGQLISKKWGKSVNNKLGWVIMEFPVVLLYVILWAASDRRANVALIAFSVVFLTHYIQRTFIFPMLIRGDDKMPWSIISFGMIFNTCNALMQGWWLFYDDRTADLYTEEWLGSAQFIIGVIVFAIGFIINIHSDSIIRNLRKPGDTNFYIPKGGMFKFVTSANYLGELTEWIGWAILTLSHPGILFAVWTFANLGPRAHSLRKWYSKTFGEEFDKLNRKRIIPFLW